MGNEGIIYVFNDGHNGGSITVQSIQENNVTELLNIPFGNDIWPFSYWIIGNSIIADDEGVIHLSFQHTMLFTEEEWYSEVICGKYVNGQWTFESFENKTLDASSYGIRRTTHMKLDSTSSPHICYYDETDDAIKHAYKVDSEWVTEIVANGSAYDISMAIDSKDNICLSYFNTSERDLRYSQSTENGWYTITIDKSGVVGKQSSIAIDSQGIVHISYYDETNTYLKHAYRTESEIMHLYVAEGIIISSLMVWIIWSRKKRADAPPSK